MNHVNFLLLYWIDSHWFIALVMSACVNIGVYLCAAYLLSMVIRYSVNLHGLGEFINDEPLKNKQVKMELKNGVFACIIFAFGSLASRELFSSVWPGSGVDVILQVCSFIIFYETYSYFIHRVLHFKVLARFHGVHHKSVRVTPWSAYSVHPIEAFFIGVSAPLFMLFFNLSLGFALTLHVFGMIFTILLHSNFQYVGNNVFLKLLFSYPKFHAKHHNEGDVNYGFFNKGWDSLFGTLSYKK